MSSAMNPMKNFGWFAIILLVVMMLYPLSLNVASLRGDLMQVDRNILSTKKEINYLQAELKARANLQQLEEWNDLLYGFQSPTAAQFADGERALANLGRKSNNIRPVLISANGVNGAKPAGVIGSPFAPLQPVTAKQAASSLPASQSGKPNNKEKAAAPHRIASIDELLDEIDEVKVAQSGESEWDQP